MNKQIKYPNKLKELRLTRGLKQSELAQFLQMQCEDRISRWEQGFAMPNAMNLFKIASVLQVLPHEIYPELIASETTHITQQVN